MDRGVVLVWPVERDGSLPWGPACGHLHLVDAEECRILGEVGYSFKILEGLTSQAAVDRIGEVQDQR